MNNEQEINQVIENREKKKKEKIATTIVPPMGPYPFFWGNSMVPPHFQSTLISWAGCLGIRLIYKGSEHGFAASNFHGYCNNQGPTLTVIRSNNGYYFGGFNKGVWTGSSSSQTGTLAHQSFIFTLTNPYSIAPTRYNWNGTSYAAFDTSSYGPTFGGGHDIHVSNACTSSGSYFNFPHCYTDSTGYGKNTFTGSNRFVVSDIEVFACNY